MIRERAQILLDRLGDPTASAAAVRLAAQALYHPAIASPDIASEALRLIAAAVDHPDPERAAVLAMTCGGLVEHGADPAPLVDPLLRQLAPAAAAARRFRDAAVAEVEGAPASDPDDDDDYEELEGGDGGGQDDLLERFESARERLSPAMPGEARAWDFLGRLFPAAIALFSASPPARAAARPLLPDLLPVDAFHVGAHWLARMIRVLDHEPYVVIEPSTQTGIAGTFSGVSDNFQLNVLLMDTFPRHWWQSRRVSRSAAAIARGEGPQQGGEIVTGTWNLHTFQALRPDGTLPPPPKGLSGNTAWIWNEGVPAEIPALDNHRVILLGPPSYARHWPSQRDFAKLRAELTVDRELDATEVTTWLRRIAAATGDA